MEYRAVTKEDPNKDLTHWKYIKRYKGSDGKWKYVYADKKLHKEIDDKESESDLKYQLAKEYEKKKEEMVVKDWSDVSEYERLDSEKAKNAIEAGEIRKERLILIDRNKIESGFDFIRKLFGGD